MDVHSIGGQHLYYLESCRRQLWLYILKVQLEEGHERIELGRVIHEESFRREAKEIQIAGMKIDFISKDGYVHETKSSKKPKKEHETQPLFYAWYLKHVLGFGHIRGARIHYPEIRDTVTVDLDEERAREVEEKVRRVLEVARQPDMPPVHENMSLCRKCAYFEFCHV